MMFRIPDMPLRRYRHGASRAVRDAVAALLGGRWPTDQAGRRPRGAIAVQMAPPAAEAPGIAARPEAGSAAHEAWSRLQSGFAAGG